MPKKPSYDELEKRLAAAERALSKQQDADTGGSDIDKIFKTVFESANVGKSITQLDGAVKVNHAFADMLGYSIEEMGRMTWQELTPEADIVPIQKQITPILQGKLDAVRFDKRYIHKSGSFIWADISITAQRDSSGKLIRFITTVVNITERKAAEEALQTSNSLLNSILESPENIIMFALDKEYKYLSYNKAHINEMKRIYNADINIGELIFSYMPNEDDRKKAEINYKRVLAGERFNEIQEYGQADTRFWYELIFNPILDKAEDVTGFTVFVQDISERKHTEIALQQSEELLANITKHAPGAIFKYLLRPDGTSHFPYISEGIRLMSPYEAEEIYKDTSKTFESCHPDDYNALIESIADSAKNLSPWQHEFRLVLSDYDIRTIYGKSQPQREADGSIVWYGFFTDITELQDAEDRLRDSEKMFRVMFETSPAGMALCDMDGTLTQANNAYLSIIGYTLAETLDLTYWDLTPIEYEEEEAKQLKSLNQTGKYGPYEKEYINQNGDRVPVLLSGMIVEDQAGIQHIWSVVQDISERKQIEQDKLNFEKQILQTQKLESLGVLAGGIAHDFNNILMGILGYADLALTDLDPIDPAREFVQGINDSTRKAAGLVKQMLAYSGKGKFSLEPIDLNHLIEDTIQMLEISISKNAIMKFNFSDNPVFLEGDPSQIRQIIMNLVINASDAVGKKSGVIALTTGSMYCDRDYIKDTGFEAQIAHSVEIAEGMYTFVEVSDTGTGMSKETLVRIFEPFYTTKFTGRGLGLSAVLGIVRGHHGMVKIYSEEGKGSTFKILFPLFEHAGDSTAFESVGGIDSDWRGSGTFLIADDEEAVRTVGKHMLEKLGFQVLTAADGREAVETFKKHSADVVGVLLDLTMPHKDGAEVFREIRKLNSDIKVILTSGYNEQDATQQFVGKGLAGFIQKPYVGKELVGKIKELMDNPIK